jgi:hypothetical protein
MARPILYVLIFLALISIFVFFTPHAEKTEEISEAEFHDVFLSFNRSSYLQDMWQDTCIYPLEAERCVLVSKVVKRGYNVSISCHWNMKPKASYGPAILTENGKTDVSPRWLSCGVNGTFAYDVLGAIYDPGTELIHLGEGPGAADDGTYYVLVCGCHQWDDYFCKSYGSTFCERADHSDILSVAYAVMDGKDGEVYW